MVQVGSMAQTICEVCWDHIVVFGHVEFIASIFPHSGVSMRILHACISLGLVPGILACSFWLKSKAFSVGISFFSSNVCSSRSIECFSVSMFGPCLMAWDQRMVVYFIVLLATVVAVNL